MRFRIPIALVLCLGPSLPAHSRDDKAVESQKTAVTAHLTRAGLKKLITTETDHLLVISSLVEAKAKTVAEAAEKTYVTAHKELKLDEKLWPGKLTLVVLGDNREFSAYVRVVTQRRPDSLDWYSINVRGDVPTAAVSVDTDRKIKDAEMNATVSTVVAAALLNKKAGTSPTTGTLPEWVQLGFGKLMTVRTVGGSMLSDYRSKSKAIVVGTKSRPSPVRLASNWDGRKSKDSDIVAASVIEYMMYGIEGDKFFAFAAGFKPSETTAMPTVESAFEGVEWKMDAFEVGWKVWHSKQK